MPEKEEKKSSEELVNVGETVGADIDFDDKGEPVKQEEVVEEKIEVEEAPASDPQDKTFENERTTKLDKKEDKDELKEYSDGVQKRIAKLTRKMREAERQREEAVQYAQAAKQDKDRLESKLSTLDKARISTTCGYVLKMGDLAYKDTEKFGKPWCKKGDWVIFARYAGSRLPIEGGEVRILNDDEVLGTIKDPESVLHLI